MTTFPISRELKTTPLIEHIKEDIKSLLTQRQLIIDRMYQYRIDIRIDTELESNCVSSKNLLLACDKAIIVIDAEIMAAKNRLDELITKEYQSGNLTAR